MSALTDHLADAEARLGANLTCPNRDFWTALANETNALLTEALSAADETANKAWFINQVARAYSGYVDCFEQMRSGLFYEAWCGLEQVEIALPWLLRNPFLDPGSFAVTELQARVEQWQSLYPYKVFFSPGFLHKKQECSICHTVLTPWSRCAHEVGVVYGGRMCVRIVSESEFLEISLVLDPVQKYSVALAGRDAEGRPADHHDHSIARFLVERLSSPFDNWSAHWTEALHPHAMFPDATPAGACPCEAGRSYAKCCQQRRGVIRPHVQFAFEKLPPSHLSQAAFAGYGDRNGPAAMTQGIPHAAE